MCPDPHFAGLLWSPRSTRLASIRSDKTIKVWDVLTGKEIFSVDYGGRGIVYDAYCAWAWSPDDARLAIVDARAGSTGVISGDITIWDVGSGRSLQEIPSVHALVLAWSPDGKTLAANVGSGGLHLYDPVTGKQQASVPCHGAFQPTLGWSRDSRRIAWFLGGGGIYDVQTGNTTSLEENGMPCQFTQLVWNPDGKELAATDGVHVVIYNASTGKKSSAPDKFPGMSLCWTEGGLSGVRVDAAGFKTGAVLPPIVLTNAATGKTLGLGCSDEEVEQFQANYFAGTVAWAPSGQEVALAGNTRRDSTQSDPAIAVFDLASGRKVRGFPLTLPPVKVSWTANGYIEIVTDKSVEALHLGSGKTESLRSMDGGQMSAEQPWCKLSPDGRLAAGVSNGPQYDSPATVKVWDAITHKPKYEFELVKNPAQQTWGTIWPGARMGSISPGGAAKCASGRWPPARKSAV